MEGRCTFALVRDSSAAAAFLATLNEAHPSINFTMETAANEIITTDHHLDTSVYRKKTIRGLLFHYQSHVDFRYKRSLLMRMLNRANRMSSSPDLLSKECRSLKAVFLKLRGLLIQQSADSTILSLTIELGQ